MLTIPLAAGTNTTMKWLYTYYANVESLAELISGFTY
jgi:hypothetical protein